MASLCNHIFLFVLTFGVFSITFTKGQSLKPATVLEGGQVILSITFPETSQVDDTSVIYIKLDPQDGTQFSEFTNIVFVGLKQSSFKISDPYKSKIQSDLTGRTLQMTLSNVGPSDAGFFRCYTSSSEAGIIPNCGQQLVLLRKPETLTIETVSPDDTLIAGNKLRLECKTKSTSLPLVHSLPLKIRWREENGAFITTGGRFYVNDQDELQVDRLSRDDKDLKFSCLASDDASNDRLDEPLSEPSSFYTVVPEYAPTKSDLKVDPSFADGDKLAKKVGDNLRYSCAADCNPPCEVKWMYKSNAEGARYGEVQGLIDKSVLVKKALSRYDPGTYRCRADNKHSEEPAKTSFKLELLYIEAPEVFMNNKATSNLSVFEDVQTNLKCVFDAHPRPLVVWKSPAGVELQASEASGPQDQVADTNVLEHLYTSQFQLDPLTCEESGIYSCHGSSPNSRRVEGRMNINVQCAPSPADLPGQSLEEEYVWEPPQALELEFVMRGYPVPRINKIWSSLNDDDRRPEMIGTDVFVNKRNPYDDKAWLTLFQIKSGRSLTVKDAGRTFFMEFESTGFNRIKYQFKIRPRGPPHKVQNITLENVKHDSVEVFWQPGSDGGEEQSFSVEYRKKGEESSAWVVAKSKIPEPARGLWQTIKVTGLRASTEYTGRIVASNVLGTSEAEFSLKTTAAPSGGGLSAGAIVGIVFAVLIFLVIVAFLLYWFVYRKRYGKGGDDFSFAGMRDTLKALITRKEEKPSQNGRVSSDSDKPKKNPIFRMKKMVKGIPKKLKRDYNTVPVKAEDDDDYDSEFDDDDHHYINTTEQKPAKTDEIVYANASAIRKNAEEKQKNLGREKNEEGLIYVSVDHANSNLKPLPKNNVNNNNNGNNNSSSDNKGEGETSKLFDQPKDDAVEYSTIDFSQTPTKDGVHQEVRAEVNPMIKHETEDAPQPEDKDTSSAADGGADVTIANGDVEAADGGAEYMNAGVVVPESKFGTAV